MVARIYGYNGWTEKHGWAGKADSDSVTEGSVAESPVHDDDIASPQDRVENPAGEVREQCGQTAMFSALSECFDSDSEPDEGACSRGTGPQADSECEVCGETPLLASPDGQGHLRATGS